MVSTDRIAVTVLSGYLGAGKTTLVRSPTATRFQDGGNGSLASSNPTATTASPSQTADAGPANSR